MYCHVNEAFSNIFSYENLNIDDFISKEPKHIIDKKRVNHKEHFNNVVHNLYDQDSLGTTNTIIESFDHLKSCRNCRRKLRNYNKKNSNTEIPDTQVEHFNTNNNEKLIKLAMFVIIGILIIYVIDLITKKKEKQ